jgi:hypothetical protein
MRSYISLGNSGRPARVTGRRGSPLPQLAAASAASGTKRVEAPKPGREDVSRVAPPTAPPAIKSRHETTPATIVASLVIGPRSVDSHDAVSPTLHRWRRSQLCSWHTQTSSYLLHLDELRAHTLLSDGSSNDKTNGWCLDTGATHHKTGRREFQGSVKFGDASDVEIKGVGSVIFTAESGEHRLLIGVYYIPALRNSIISLRQLDESGSRVEIKDGVMRIWDRHHRLLAKVTRGTSRLYVLNVQVAQPLCLAAHRDDEAWQWLERFGHLHFEALKRLSAKGMVRGLPSLDHMEQFCDVCVLTKQRRLPFPQQSSF